MYGWNARVWLGSVQTALCTFAFIAACLSARSCNLDHSHPLFLNCANTLQSTSMTTFFVFVPSFPRSFLPSFPPSLLLSFVECMAETAGCGVVLNDQVWVRLYSLLACCLHECLKLQSRSPSCATLLYNYTAINGNDDSALMFVG